MTETGKQRRGAARKPETPRRDVCAASRKFHLSFCSRNSIKSVCTSPVQSDSFLTGISISDRLFSIFSDRIYRKSLLGRKNYRSSRVFHANRYRGMLNHWRTGKRGPAMENSWVENGGWASTGRSLRVLRKHRLKRR